MNLVFSILILICFIGVVSAILKVFKENKRRRKAKEELKKYEENHPL